MKLTELLAMPIVDLRTACPVGVISGFAADDKLRSITQCVIIDDNTYAEELLYPWSSLRQGADAYCLVGAQAPAISGVRVPFKSKLYTTDGLCVGMLQDVECTESGKVQNLLLTDGSSIDPAQIYKVGEVIILKGTRKVPRTAKSAKRNTDNAASTDAANPLPQSPTAYFALPQQQEIPTVDTQPATQPNESAVPQPTTVHTQTPTDTVPLPATTALGSAVTMPQDAQPPQDTATPTAIPAVQTVPVPPNGIALRSTAPAVSPTQNDVPYRLVTDYDFLLGRTLTKDLVQSGHVFIAKGTVIDDYAVQLAGRAGLLVALTTISR